jgi:hypothetical protein
VESFQFCSCKAIEVSLSFDFIPQVSVDMVESNDELFVCDMVPNLEVVDIIS